MPCCVRHVVLVFLYLTNSLLPYLLCYLVCIAPPHTLLLPPSIRNLQAELNLVCEDRDKLAQELKRTPELIEKAMTDLREQCERPHDYLQPIMHYLFVYSITVSQTAFVIPSLPPPALPVESKLRRQQQDLEQSRAEVREAVVGREEAQQSLQQSQTQLEESKANLEQLHSQLLSQQELSEQGEARRGLLLGFI